MKTIPLYNRYILVIATLLLLLSNSCEDFVEVPAPQTELVRSTVFADDAAAKAAMADIYYQLINGGFASGDTRSITFLTALSSDELIDFTSGDFSNETLAFNQNELVPNGVFVENLWKLPYAIIYRANAIIEGLTESSGVSQSLRNQLLGEARFMRALSHFYLVNLFGRVPVIVTTDYKQNTSAERAEIDEVYEQIVQDLEEAKTLLPPDYSFSGGQRIRVNKGAAIALLSRGYLFTNDYQKAEEHASMIISDPQYGLESELTLVFTNTSHEVIWQLESLTNFPNDIFTFYIFNAPTAGALRPSFVDDFEADDARKETWIGTKTVGEATYLFPKKYQSFTAKTEYSTILRVAEQYLIRAEARVHLNNLSGAHEDLNAVRSRAKLPDTDAADGPSLLEAIFSERRSELFTEWGHRWIDLKRFGKVDDVIGRLKSTWQSTDVLYPIPYTQMVNSPSMSNDQNAGY